MAYNFDLFLFLAIVSVTIYCFLEEGLLMGFVSLMIGTVIFLLWVQHRTKIFS